MLIYFHICCVNDLKSFNKKPEGRKEVWKTQCLCTLGPAYSGRNTAMMMMMIVMIIMMMMIFMMMKIFMIMMIDDDIDGDGDDDV